MRAPLALPIKASCFCPVKIGNEMTNDIADQVLALVMGSALLGDTFEDIHTQWSSNITRQWVRKLTVSTKVRIHLPNAKICWVLWTRLAEEWVVPCSGVWLRGFKLWGGWRKKSGQNINKKGQLFRGFTYHLGKAIGEPMVRVGFGV